MISDHPARGQRPSDLDLMRIRAAADFIHDERGRMVFVNDPDRNPPPRLLIARSKTGDFIRFGAGVSASLATHLTAILARIEPRDDFALPLDVLADIREMMGVVSPFASESGGPAYRFLDSISARNDAVELTAGNLEVAREHYPWLCDELPAWAPCFAMLRNETAVSVCFSSRIGVDANEAGLDTVPAFRRQGLGVAVTAAWASAVTRSGRLPLYSTSRQNLASQAVARRLGLIQIGADYTWR